MTEGHRPTIGYVLTHHPRASQTFIDAELAAIDATGHGVTVFAMNEPEPDQIRTARDRRSRDLAVYLKAAGPPAVLRAVLAACRVGPHHLLAVALLAVGTSGRNARAAARRFAHLAEALIVWDRAAAAGIDHLHAHFAQAPSTIAWLAAELGRRTGRGPRAWSFTIHGLGEMRDPAEHLPRPKLTSASPIVCVCDATLDRLREIADTAPIEARVIRIGIDLDHFSARDHRPVGTPAVVMMVGRLAEAKGQRVAIQAIAELRGRGAMVDLVLVGDGPDRTHLGQVAERLDIARHVRFTGELGAGDVLAHLRAADIFCLPSFDEGLPVAIMEAMAVGCPVVATRIAGIPELISDGTSGLLVEPGDSSGLAEALHTLLVDDAARSAMIAAGVAAVTRHQDRSVTMPAFLAVLGITESGLTESGLDRHPDERQ